MTKKNNMTRKKCLPIARKKKIERFIAVTTNFGVEMNFISNSAVKMSRMNALTSFITTHHSDKSKYFEI